MSNLVSQEQKLRIVGQIMANLINPHTASEDLHRLAHLAVDATEAAASAFEKRSNRGLGPMSLEHDRSHKRSSRKA